MAEFKAGDTVQLKSGGPIMTIKRMDDDGEAFCDWFTKAGKREQGRFPGTSLKKATVDDAFFPSLK